MKDKYKDVYREVTKKPHRYDLRKLKIEGDGDLEEFKKLDNSLIID